MRLISGLSGRNLPGRQSELAQQIQRQECCMSFIEMIVGDVEPEGLQDQGTANPQDDLLLETITFIASVQVISNLSIHWPVLLNVGVEQQDRHTLAKRGSQPIKPGSDPDFSPLDCGRDHGIKLLRPFFSSPNIGLTDLCALDVDLLVDVASTA